MIKVRVIKDFRRITQGTFKPSMWLVFGQVRWFEMITGMLDSALTPFRNTTRLREVVNRASVFFLTVMSSTVLSLQHSGKQSDIDGRQGKVLKLNYCAKRDAFKDGQILMRNVIRGIPL